MIVVAEENCEPVFLDCCVMLNFSICVWTLAANQCRECKQEIVGGCRLVWPCWNPCNVNRPRRKVDNNPSRVADGSIHSASS